MPLGSGISMDLLPNCSLSRDPIQKSAVSEMTAQQLALCNSFCVNRVRLYYYFNHHDNNDLMESIFCMQVFSGTFTFNDAQKQVQCYFSMYSIDAATGGPYFGCFRGCPGLGILILLTFCVVTSTSSTVCWTQEMNPFKYPSRGGSNVFFIN